MTIWDCLTQLVQRPARRGVRGDIAMQDTTGRVFHNDKNIEQAKGGRHHHTEITRHNGLSMVAYKCCPALRRHPLAWSRVLALQDIFASRAR